MISASEHSRAVAKTIQMFKEAGIALTKEEESRIEVADFGLDNLSVTGLELLTYVNTERCCAKELAMFPHQTCPEHRHPSINGAPGKEETFRCRKGVVHLFVPGEPTPNPQCVPPQGDEAYYTSRKEIILHPGDQYTINPDTLHWFQSGNDGAIVSEFSTKSQDEYDVFTDPRILRETKIKEEG